MTFSTTPGPGEVHLYLIEDGGDPGILSDLEKARYEGYRTPEAAALFLKSRSALRKIAAAYTGKTPSAFELDYSAEGKPFFRCTPELQFNMSHTRDTLCLVFSCEPVGIDIENKARRADFQSLAKRWFHPEESARVAAGGDRESMVFLELWTAKEAMLKLVGKGIAAGLDKARVLESGEGVFESTRIFLHRLAMEKCVGAVASFSPIRKVREATY